MVSLRRPLTVDGSSSAISGASVSSWHSGRGDAFPYRWRISHKHRFDMVQKGTES